MEKILGLYSFSTNKDKIINNIKFFHDFKYYNDENIAVGKTYNHHYILENNFLVLFVGELYNKNDLYIDLERKGYFFNSYSNEEIILNGYLEYNTSFFDQLNGNYIFLIFDKNTNEIIITRDRLGTKSLFYTIKNELLYFSSSINELLQFEAIEPIIDEDGFSEIIAIGPSRTHGSGVFKNISEIKPGHYIKYNKNEFFEIEYWDLKSKKHEENYSETVDIVSTLLSDSITKQSKSDFEFCSMLSGGLDSSIITGFLANKTDKQLPTYSFDFVGNDKFFKSNSFQPEEDKEWAVKMSKSFNTKHNFLFCDAETLKEKLYDAVDAKSLPGMADIDSSFLYFCKQISENYKIAFSGECADEIFGGYPWFHKENFFNANTFPWSIDLDARKFIWKKNIWKKIDADNYIHKKYVQSIEKVPILESDNKIEKRRREIAYLNTKWFMSTLLYRLEKISSEANLIVRTPFSDYRILEYVFNVPWEFKAPNGVVKGLLRDAFSDLLPKDILERKKSPYPKIYNPAYEKILKDELSCILKNKNEPILNFIDIENVTRLIESTSEYGKPWYGQLMAAPQMMAYIIQINYWIKKYNVNFSFL